MRPILCRRWPVALPSILIAYASLHGCGGEKGTEPSSVGGQRPGPVAAVEDAEVEAAAAACPSLLAPREDATVDNGRYDRRDRIAWTFRWSSFSGASAYQLYVKHRGSRLPLLNRTVSATSYQHVCYGCYVADVNRFNWSWRVRAKVAGQWRPWSPERTFRIERANTDPPS